MKRIQPLDKAGQEISPGDIVIYGTPIGTHSATLQYGKVLRINFNLGKRLNLVTGGWDLVKLPCFWVQGVIDHYAGTYLSSVDQILSRYSLLKVGLEHIPASIAVLLCSITVPAPIQE